MISLPRVPGTYVIIMNLTAPAKIAVGRLGTVAFPVGDYAYVGSAFGPGGIAARLGHHLTVSRRPRWHLDYLRPHLIPVTIWYTIDRHPREHDWAGALRGIRGAALPCRGFGSSDCRCAGHLVWFARRPSAATFRRHAHRIAETAIRVVPVTREDVHPSRSGAP